MGSAGPWLGAVGLLVGSAGVVWGLMLRRCLRLQVAAAEEARQSRSELERQRAEALLAAREEAEARRRELEAEYKERQADQRRLQGRLDQREAELDRRIETLYERERAGDRREADLQQREQSLSEAEREQAATLGRIARLTPEEARAELLRQVEESSRLDAAALVRNIEEEARFEADRRARQIITQAIERCGVDHAAETTVSVVNLDGDEVKGRIIGREGRNIRCFEQLTGVDLVVDDTPETVVISAFDPVRREIARQALETLVADGRIHPARIEEVVPRTQRQVEQAIGEAGEQAAFEAQVSGLSPALLQLLGRLKYRTSYGQNVLQHSLEVASMAAVMAAELGANVAVCRRAALLHDIGKAVDEPMDGPHAAVGADLARRHGESEPVCHAVAAHHREVEPETPEALLVATADAISAARPGARRDGFEVYLERLERLEELALDFEGVEKVYAIQAGREIRVLVRPDEIDDDRAADLARDLAQRIQAELAYPGQIKVTVIREQRAVEYAR